MCAVLWQHRENLDQWAVRNTCGFFFFFLSFPDCSSTRFSDRVCQLSTASLNQSDLHYISL